MTIPPAYLTRCEQRIIDIADGAVEYLWVDVVDRNKDDITSAAVSISLGTFGAPGVWHAADVVQPGSVVWKLRAALLIGGSLTYPTGQYYAWTKTVVGAETILNRVDNMIVTIIGAGDSGLYGAGLYGAGTYGG